MSDVHSAFERAAVLKEQVKEELLSKANVIGVGIGYKRVGDQKTDQVALVVLVSQKVAPDSLSNSDLIPTEIGGFPVDIQEIGEVGIQD